MPVVTGDHIHPSPILNYTRITMKEPRLRDPARTFSNVQTKKPGWYFSCSVKYRELSSDSFCGVGKRGLYIYH